MLRKAKWLIKETQLRVKYRTSKDCIFCKIASGEISSKPVLENNNVIAINDVNPVADVHILIIPKKHIDSVLTISDSDAGDIVEMHKAAQQLVKEKNLDAFRLAFNGGKYQHVPHLHMHLLAGGSVQWKKF